MEGKDDSVVVLIHRPGDVLKTTSRELLTLARSIGSPVALVLGPVSASLNGELALYGASRIMCSTHEEIEHFSVGPQAEILAAAMRKTAARLALVDNTPDGKDIAGRAGVLLDAAVVSDAVDIAADGAVKKSVLADTYEVRLTTGNCCVMTVREHSVQAQAVETPAQLMVEEIAMEFSAAARSVRILERIAAPRDEGPALDEASIVVAGGRGVNGDFAPIELLAQVLGGAVGASRVATDEGWIDHSAQIGQTGRTVAPQLYIAAGISGAIQQRVGMQNSRLILAINTDPDAPIFDLADLGIVGDLFRVIPQAIEEIQRRRTEGQTEQ